MLLDALIHPIRELIYIVDECLGCVDLVTVPCVGAVELVDVKRVVAEVSPQPRLLSVLPNLVGVGLRASDYLIPVPYGVKTYGVEPVVHLEIGFRYKVNSEERPFVRKP